MRWSAQNRQMYVPMIETSSKPQKMALRALSFVRYASRKVCFRAEPPPRMRVSVEGENVVWGLKKWKINGEDITLSP